MMAEIVQKIWGSEEIIVNEGYCGKRMTLMENACCSLHKHDIKDETFYVSEGEMLLEIVDGTSQFYVLTTGHSFRIKPGTLHRFYGMQPTVFYEFSTHDDPNDSIRETQSQIGLPEDLAQKLVKQIKPQET